MDAGAAATWTAAAASPRVVAPSARRRAPRPAPTPAPTEARVSAPRVRPVVMADEPVLLGEAAAPAAAVAASIRETGADWIGTPYRFGGEGRSGIDCSAFTRQVFRETFGIELPRNTALQVQEGFEVSRGDLAPGDLVFFRRGGTRHVGVYLGDGEFIHASTSRGVMISNLSEGYFDRYYWTSRRILAEPTGAFADGVRRRPLPRAEREARAAAGTDFDAPDFEWEPFEEDEETAEPALPAPAQPGPARTGARGGW